MIGTKKINQMKKAVNKAKKNKKLHEKRTMFIAHYRAQL